MQRLLAFVGAGVTDSLSFVGETWTLLGETTFYVLRGAVNWRLTVRQMAAVGVGSLPVAMVTIAFSGAVLSYHTADFFVRYGFSHYLGAIVAEAVFREMAPALTAVVVAARAGSAMAAEIGSMKVTEQLDALRSLATSPVQYLVVPRLLAALVMLPLLTIYADLVGLAGAFMAATFFNISLQVFVSSVARNFDHWPLVAGLIKSVVFAIIIVVVACHQGFATKRGAAGVGRATTNSVVLCIMLIYVSDLVLTVILFPPL